MPKNRQGSSSAGGGKRRRQKTANKVTATKETPEKKPQSPAKPAGIAVTCSCGANYSLRKTMAGHVILCKECNAEITVPGERIVERVNVNASPPFSVDEVKALGRVSRGLLLTLLSLVLAMLGYAVMVGVSGQVGTLMLLASVVAMVVGECICMTGPSRSDGLPVILIALVLYITAGVLFGQWVDRIGERVTIFEFDRIRKLMFFSSLAQALAFGMLLVYVLQIAVFLKDKASISAAQMSLVVGLIFGLLSVLSEPGGFGMLGGLLGLVGLLLFARSVQAIRTHIALVQRERLPG